MERCVYCGTERGRSFGCCGEVHFEDEPEDDPVDAAIEEHDKLQEFLERTEQT